MTVTITIMCNSEYIDKYRPELVKVVPEHCQCFDPSLGPDPDCPMCGGTGVDPIIGPESKWYPFEMNIASANFITLWSALGLEVDKEDPCGHCDGRQIIDALERVMPELMVRTNHVEVTHKVTPDGSAEHINTFTFGIDLIKAQRYIKDLREIAEEAIKREEPVYWC